MNINQHFSNLATKAAQDGADASQLISQRERLFKDKVIPELTKRGANDTAIVQAREKWYSQTDKVMQSAGLLPKAGQNSRSFAKDKRADKAVQEAVKTGSNFPIIKEALKSTGETIGNLFGQGVGGMIEGAAGFVRDIGENEKNSTSARIAKYGKNLKKDYENSASTFQKELQGGQHGKIPQLSAGAIQSVPAMALPFGAAKGVATVATKVPILASKAPYLGIVAGKAAEHTQNYGEVRRNATANLERDFPTWEKLQGNPLFEQNFNERLNNGLTITQAREQAYAATLDQLSEKASDKYGTAMTAIGFIAPSGAVLGSGILKNAPTSKIGKALTGGGVDSALVKREMQQVPRTGMAKLVPDMSIAANKAAAKMVGKQALEEGLQGGIGEYGAQAASANIGGTPVDYGKVGQTILEEGLVGGIMGGGMQSATGGSPTSQAKDVAKQLRNQTNTLRQEEAAARKELADAMQLNDPAALQSAQDNLNNIGAEASKVKAAYDQYGIDTPYFVQRFAAQYQPQQQQAAQQGPAAQPQPQPQPQPAPQAAAQPQPTPAAPFNQGMANTTNLVMDSVSNGFITAEEAQAIQTDPIRADVFTLTMTGDVAAAHNVVMNAVSLGNIDTDQAQELIQSITRYSQTKAPKKPSVSSIVNNHVKQQIHPQDRGLFSNPAELDPNTFEPIDPNQPSPFQEDFNEPKEFHNAAKANDYVRINGLTDSHDIEIAEDGTIVVFKKQGIIPDDPNLNDFGYKPKNIVQPTPADPNLSNFSEGMVSVDSLNPENVPDLLDPEEVQQPVQPTPTKQPDHNKPKTFTNYVRANDYLKSNGLKDSHEIIKKGEGQIIVQPKSAAPGEDFGSDQAFDDMLNAVPPAGTPTQNSVKPVQAADPATDFDSDEAFDELLSAVPPSGKQTDPAQQQANKDDSGRELSNAEQITGIFSTIGNAFASASIGDLAEKLSQGKRVQYFKPASIEAAKKNLNYHVADNEDGSADIIGVRDDKGVWHGQAPKTDEATTTTAPSDNPSFADKFRDAHLNNPSIKPRLINDEIDSGRSRADVLKEATEIVKAINATATPELVPEPGTPAQTPIEQKTDESGIQKNDAPEGIKSGDIGRGSDGKPFLSKNAANRGLKLRDVEKTHEVVQLAPSQFVLRHKDGAVELNRLQVEAEAPINESKQVSDPLEFPLDKVKEAYGHAHLSPGNTARAFKESFDKFIQAEIDDAQALATTEAQQTALDEAIDRVKTQYINEALPPLLNAASATVSSARAGRNNFNSKQADQRGSALDKATAKFDAELERLKGYAKLKVLAARTPKQKQADAEAEAQAQAEKDAAEQAKVEAQIKADAEAKANKKRASNEWITHPDSAEHMTMEEWKAIGKDYKGITDGVRRHMGVPVWITDEGKSKPKNQSNDVLKVGDTITFSEVFDYALPNEPYTIVTAAKAKITLQSESGGQFSFNPNILAIEKAKNPDLYKVDSAKIEPEQPAPPAEEMKKGDVGRKSDNQPFANKSAATTTIKKEGLSDTHEVVQLAPSQFVLREKLDSEQEQSESSISDMNNAKQSIDRTVTLVTHDHFLKGSLGDTQHSKSEIIRSIPNEMMDQVHKLEDIFSDLSSLQADEVKTNVTYNKELLIKLAKLNPDVRVHIVSDLANSSDLIIQSISDQLLEGGFYSIDSRISYIYPRSSEWKGTVSELINHELIHAATQEHIDTDKLTPEQLEHLDEIKETIWSNNRESFDNIDSDVLDRINYAIFTSYPHEMFTVFGAESSPREILSQIGILDRFDTIFNNVLKEAANDNGQIKQRSSGRFNEEGTSERVSGNAFRVPGTISAIRTTTSSSENIERSPSNQPASLSSPEKDEVGQVDDKRKQESNSGSDSPLRSRTKNQKVQGSNPNQVRAELVSRFGGDTIQQLEQKGILSIVPTYAEQGVEGFAENGRVTLVADAITPENIVPVFLHELGGHIGMQGVLKASAYDNLMSEFNRLVKSGNPDAIEAKRLAERESDAQVQADEYLPYLITVAARNQQNQGPAQKLINRVLSAVKAWAVDRLGLNLKLNSNDMVALAERMIKTISKGTPPTPPKGERRYSRSSTANPQNMSQTKQRELLDKAASTAFGQMSLRGAEGAKTLSSRTLNLFQTMLHKSLRDETGQFKKTFDLVQGKINHVTFASSKSMDVAPNVLIQLEQGEDYWKEVKRVGRTIGHTFSGGKIDKAKVDKDLKKVGDLMFENTLMDNSERHSVKELKQLGFDDDQIGLYNEVRDAIDTSLDTFANTTFSNIYKHLGGTNEEVLELAAQDLDIVDHYNEILKRIDTLTKGKPEKAEARQAAIEAIDRVFKKANDLKDQGYVPLMRFGKYFVRIYNPTTGEVAYRQHFESESERNLFYRNYDQSKIPAGYEIEQGQINELQHKLFQGVSPETVALFAKESGLPIGDAETAYIKYAVQNNPALKRLLKRQGVDGFDSDLKRVLASFVMSNARYSANQSYNPAIDESITNIEDPAFQEDAIQLRDYSLDTQEELAAVKNFAFVWYMGFSAMFGVVNLTQPLLQTFPYLMQYSRDKGTILRAFRKAVITWRKGTDAMDRKYKDHYERARKEGHLDPQNTWMMQGLERGKSGLGASTWQLVSHASGLFAQASETVNRRTSLFAALDVAESLGQTKLEQLGFKDAYDFAVRTIQETQGIYNKGNRPRVARGNVGSVLMMYKQFMIAYIEQMVRMQKSGLYGGEDDEFKKKMAALVGFGVSRSVLTMLGILMALSGTTGLPFVRDILDGIETAGGLVGKPVNTEREIQIALHDALGQTMGSAVNTALMDGFINLNPFIDFKGRMGMGDLIPATAYFSPTTSDYMKSSEISQIAGPIGGLLEKVKESVALAQVGAYGQSGVQLLPKAITSVGQGAIAATTGDYRNMKTGVKTNDVTPWEGVIKILDAQPASIAKEGRVRGYEMKDKSAQTYVNARWRERYVNALESGDRTQVLTVKQEIREYNKSNPRYPVKFNQKLAETNFKKSNQSWQEKRKTVKGLEWMSEYNPYLDQ